jgi:ABC-2 type transport system ATP-binding protein
MSVIEICALSKTYRGKKGSKVHALHDVSLAVEAGEVFGFLGPNGAGKSTTIKALMGMITPTSGSASLCDMPVMMAAARARVGFLPENPAFYDFLSAREYLAFVGVTFGMEKAAIEQRSEEVLRLLELSDAAWRPIRTYSKGMVQRLGLAQAMIHDPDVYILDEPMSGLDPLGRALVKDIIRGLKDEGKTVFFSTHITADVETVCDRVGIIVSGRLQLVEMVADVLESGIEGYYVQVRNCPSSVYAGFGVRDKSDEVKEVYVPREDFTAFMARLSTVKGDVDLIEPKRKDLEAFFLEVVARGNQ